MAELSKHLECALSDSYVLYLKTQNYHWNIKGPHFYSYHKLLEEMYTDLAEAIDVLAERLRAMGLPAPGSFRSFLALTRLQESDGAESSAQQMLEILAKDQQAILETLKKAAEAAEEAKDLASADILTQRIIVHEKNHWMLKSSLTA